MWRQVNHTENFHGDVIILGAMLKETDNEQLSVDRERIEFERLKDMNAVEEWENDQEDRRLQLIAEREERKVERENWQRLKLENFQLMMDVLRNGQ